MEQVPQKLAWHATARFITAIEEKQNDILPTRSMSLAKRTALLAWNVEPRTEVKT